MVANPTLRSFDPNRPDFSEYGLSCVYWQPTLMSRPDHHNEVELNFLKSGSVTYLLGGRKIMVEVGKLSIFWAAIPHQIIDFARDTVYFAATIPLPHFLEWRLPDHFAQSLLQGQFLCELTAAGADSDAWLFERWEADLQKKVPEIERAVLLEMQARLTRLAFNLRTNIKAGVKRDHLSTITNIGLTKIEQMACFIAKYYTQKLTVKQISEFVNLNPNYAMSLFQKTFGTTLINYLTQHRVSHAQRLLTMTDLPITEIALQSGFLSISRFNDAFCRLCGISPREYRKTHKFVGDAGKS